jgi:hypothetical protein
VSETTPSPLASSPILPTCRVTKAHTPHVLLHRAKQITRFVFFDLKVGISRDAEKMTLACSHSGK